MDINYQLTTIRCQPNNVCYQDLGSKKSLQLSWQMNSKYRLKARGGTTSSDSQNILYYVIPELQIQAQSHTHTPVAA